MSDSSPWVGYSQSPNLITHPAHTVALLYERSFERFHFLTVAPVQYRPVQQHGELGGAAPERTPVRRAFQIRARPGVRVGRRVDGARKHAKDLAGAVHLVVGVPAAARKDGPLCGRARRAALPLVDVVERAVRLTRKDAARDRVKVVQALLGPTLDGELPEHVAENLVADALLFDGVAAADFGVADVCELFPPLRRLGVVEPARPVVEVKVPAREAPRVWVRVALGVVPEPRVGLDGGARVDVEARDLQDGLVLAEQVAAPALGPGAGADERRGQLVKPEERDPAEDPLSKFVSPV